MAKFDEPMIEIRRVTQQDLERQQALGWPDFHPEDYCHRCGNPNCVWWIDSDIWNHVMLDANGNQRWWGIVCPICFTELAGDVCVELQVDAKTRSGQTLLAKVRS